MPCMRLAPSADARMRAQVPLDIVDLSHVSILYTVGDMAAITPIYDYNFQVGTFLPSVLANGADAAGPAWLHMPVQTC